MCIGNKHEFEFRACFFYLVLEIPIKVKNVIVVGGAAVLWVLWKTRNSACFDNIYQYDTTIIF